MVGKVFRVDGDYVFYHEGLSSQWHRNHRSPGPVDTIVIDALEEWGVKYYYHHVKDKGTSYRVELKTIKGSPREHYDDRDRYYPGIDVLDEVASIESPWIVEEVTLR